MREFSSIPETEHTNPLKIALLETNSFGRSIKRFDVHNEDNEVIGEVELNYFPDKKIAMIPSVIIHKKFVKKGYGVEIYKRLIDLSRELGCVLQSSDDHVSESAIRVWQSLERNGLAEQRGDKYIAI